MANQLRCVTEKPRIFITTDITNEPDDEESLVRYLLYSNEFDTEGIVACTSTHLKKTVAPEAIAKIVKTYEKVTNNLNAHVHPENQYPSAESLLALIRSGPACYGNDALKDDIPLSEGSKLLIEKLRESTKPLWVLGWGGANVIAQALHHLHKSVSDEEHAQIRSRLRVYTISDQDNSGQWIRTKYPDVFYICSIHGWSQYYMAAWLGVSAPGIDGGGPNQEKFSKAWLKENIQIGPLGAVYPDPYFIVEGDTPTFLYLIQNGLGSPEHPEWGSWGGRYIPISPDLTARHYADTVDKVVGKDGKTYQTNHATVWRWRDAFQNDFAARMQWTLGNERAKANHAPVVIVNGSSAGPEPIVLQAEPGAVITLDASQSYDPDGDDISFSWSHHRDVTTSTLGIPDPQVEDIAIEDLEIKKKGRKVQLRMPPAEKCAINFVTGKALEKGQVFHFVLEVKDNGTPALITYKRVVIEIQNPRLEGGRDIEFPSTTKWLEHTGLLDKIIGS